VGGGARGRSQETDWGGEGRGARKR
jgi:hypothetical protein